MADAGSPLERMSSQDRRVTIIAAQLDELEAEIAGLQRQADDLAAAANSRKKHTFSLFFFLELRKLVHFSGFCDKIP